MSWIRRSTIAESAALLPACEDVYALCARSDGDRAPSGEIVPVTSSEGALLCVPDADPDPDAVALYARPRAAYACSVASFVGGTMPVETPGLLGASIGVDAGSVGMVFACTMIVDDSSEGEASRNGSMGSRLGFRLCLRKKSRVTRIASPAILPMTAPAIVPAWDL